MAAKLDTFIIRREQKDLFVASFLNNLKKQATGDDGECKFSKKHLESLMVCVYGYTVCLCVLFVGVCVQLLFWHIYIYSLCAFRSVSIEKCVMHVCVHAYLLCIWLSISICIFRTEGSVRDTLSVCIYIY
jgi:hypothetical protein